MSLLRHALLSLQPGHFTLVAADAVLTIFQLEQAQAFLLQEALSMQRHT